MAPEAAWGETEASTLPREGCPPVASGDYLQYLVPKLVEPVHVLPVGQSLAAVQLQAELDVSHLWPMTWLLQSASVAQTQMVPEHLLPRLLVVQCALVLHSTQPLEPQVLDHWFLAQSALVLQAMQEPVEGTQYLEVPVQSLSVLHLTHEPLAGRQYL